MLAAAPSTATDASSLRVGDQPPFRRPRALAPLISMNLLCRCLGRLAELRCASVAATAPLERKKRQRPKPQALAELPRVSARIEAELRADEWVWLQRAVSCSSVRARCSSHARRLRPGRARPERGRARAAYSSGIATVLWTPVASTLMDVKGPHAATGSTSRSGRSRRRLTAGLLLPRRPRLYALTGVVGGITYRQARHVLAFASAPVALSLLFSRRSAGGLRRGSVQDGRLRPRRRQHGLRRARVVLRRLVAGATRWSASARCAAAGLERGSSSSGIE